MVEVAVITGGASGIGAALGRALVRRGAHVVLADIDGDAAAWQATTLSDAGPGTADGATVDVRDPRSVDALVQGAYRHHGRLDLMFNNAGILLGGEPEDLTTQHWDRILDVNVRGVIHGCHAAYPLMKSAGRGHIVNTASIAGLTPAQGRWAPYATTKSAVVGLSLALRSAGADHGVRVSVVCPGSIDTPLLDSRAPADLPGTPGVDDAPTLGAFIREQNRGVYPAERLAEDVLRGVAHNKAVIVAPRSTRLQWLVWRVSPELALRQALALTRTYRRCRAGSETPHT